MVLKSLAVRGCKLKFSTIPAFFRQLSTGAAAVNEVPSPFTYNTAVTRNISKCLKDYALCMDGTTKLDLNIDLAQLQHEHLTSILTKDLSLSVINLPSDDYPDSVFIEDTAVCIGSQTMITNPGATSRKGETQRVKEMFQNDSRLSSRLNKSPLSVMSNKQATLDGGDVLVAGHDLILVGYTERTSLEGIQFLKTSFPSHRVVTVNMMELQRGVSPKDRVLHLKSCCSMGGDDVLLVGGVVGGKLSEFLIASGIGKDWNNKDTALSSTLYKTTATNGSSTSVNHRLLRIVHVPDAAASNCLWVNGTMVRRATREFPASGRIFETMFRDTPQIEVECSELAKVDGAITCCSLLLNA